MCPYGPSPFGPITSLCKASNGNSCEIRNRMDLNIFKVLLGESCGMQAEYAGWGTPASLLHRMNGAAVFAASVCSNSTVPTWVMTPEATCEWTTTSFTAAKLHFPYVWTLDNSAVYEGGSYISAVHACFSMLLFWGDLMTHKSHRDFDLEDLSGYVESRPWFKVLHTQRFNDPT